MQFSTLFFATVAAIVSFATAAPGYREEYGEEVENFNLEKVFDFQDNNNQNININQNDNIAANEQESFNFFERFEREGFRDFCYYDEEGEFQYLERRSLTKRGGEFGRFLPQFANFEFNNNQNANVNQNSNLNENILKNFEEFREEREEFGGYGGFGRGRGRGGYSVDELIECFFDGENFKRK